jgi:hypothetical protein
MVLGKLNIHMHKNGAGPGMVVHTCNPSTLEAEAGGLQVQGQPGLYTKFQAKFGVQGRPYLKNKKNEAGPLSYTIYKNYLKMDQDQNLRAKK